MDKPIEKGQEATNEKPPIFKSWPLFYFIVSANLIVLLSLFYAFTKAFE